MSDPTIEQLAREVLEKHAKMPVIDGTYRDSIFIGYTEVAVAAAPQLARAYLEMAEELNKIESSRVNFVWAHQAAEDKVQDLEAQLKARERDFVAQQQVLLDLANALKRAEDAEAALDRAVTAHEQLLAAQQLLKDYRDILWRQLMVREELRDNPFPDYTRLKIEQIDTVIKIALAVSEASLASKEPGA